MDASRRNLLKTLTSLGCFSATGIDGKLIEDTILSFRKLDLEIYSDIYSPEIPQTAIRFIKDQLGFRQVKNIKINPTDIVSTLSKLPQGNNQPTRLLFIPNPIASDLEANCRLSYLSAEVTQTPGFKKYRADVFPVFQPEDKKVSRLPIDGDLFSMLYRKSHFAGATPKTWDQLIEAMGEISGPENKKLWLLPYEGLHMFGLWASIYSSMAKQRNFFENQKQFDEATLTKSIDSFWKLSRYADPVYVDNDETLIWKHWYQGKASIYFGFSSLFKEVYSLSEKIDSTIANDTRMARFPGTGDYAAPMALWGRSLAIPASVPESERLKSSVASYLLSHSDFSSNLVNNLSACFMPYSRNHFNSAHSEIESPGQQSLYYPYNKDSAFAENQKVYSENLLVAGRQPNMANGYAKMVQIKKSLFDFIDHGNLDQTRNEIKDSWYSNASKPSPGLQFS